MGEKVEVGPALFSWHGESEDFGKSPGLQLEVSNGYRNNSRYGKVDDSSKTQEFYTQILELKMSW